jgi:type IV pilus assembly protein PilF
MPSPHRKGGAAAVTPHTAFAVPCWRTLVAAVALTLVAGCSTKQTVQESPQVVPLPAPQPASPQVRAQLHTDLGAGYYERGQMDVALEELNAAVKIDPTYAQAYNIFGLVYAVLGDDRKAEQSFAQALQLAPSDSDIHHNWGWYLCQHGREHDALAEFEIAVRNPLYRTPEVALVNAGRCSQPYDERAAEGYYRRALAAQPGNPLASLGLAQIAYKDGRYEEARAWMRGVMLTTNPPPEGLRLGMCVERKLGDRQAELSYVSQLRNRYPDAPETRGLATETCQ